MKAVYGSLTFMFGIGGLIGYINSNNTNRWVEILIFILIGIGLEYTISGMIDNKKEKLKEEILEELRNR